MSTIYKIEEGRIVMIKEENEELKAQSASKSAMFKLKPEFEKLFGLMKKLGFLDSYKIRIEPYNRGYEMKFNFHEGQSGWDNIFGLDKKIQSEVSSLFSVASIYMQPDSFFQNSFELDGYTKITGSFYSNQSMGNQWVKQIKKKQDIGTAEKEFIKINLENIKKAMDVLKKVK